MEWLLLILLFSACLAGFVLFRRNTVPAPPPGRVPQGRLSVIIPARNEETNLPFLLSSLQIQTRQPFEVIVVDDCSEDRTRETAERYGVKVIAGSPPPAGWTGKNWAVWNGYRQAAGDLVAFLDADVRLAPHALEALLAAREAAGGAVSVVPYHVTEKFYEKLALISNLLGLFAFTSPLERKNPNQGLYGSCIVASRDDYERAKGHESVRSELMDDLKLGAQFRKAGIPVTNYIGRGTVAFRMYPGGIKSEVEGFSKGALLGTGKLRLGTTLLIAIWLIGLLLAEAAPLAFAFASSWWLPLAAGYALYTIQLYYFVRYTGRFGKWLPAVHGLSAVFFLFIMLHSIYQVVFHGHVAWKGRQVEVRGRSGR